MSDNASSLHPTCTSPNPDALVDLFADVSHHGASSFFEVFALPPSSLPSTVPDHPSQPPSLATHQHTFPTTCPSPPPSTDLHHFPEHLGDIQIPDSKSFTSVPPPVLVSSLPTTQHLPPVPTPRPCSHSSSKPPPSRSTTKRPSRQRRSTKKNASTKTKTNANSNTSQPLLNSLPPQPAITKSPAKRPPPIRPRPPSLSVGNEESDASAASDETPNHPSSKRGSKPGDSPAPVPSTRNNPNASTPRQPSQPNSNADSSHHSEPPARYSHNSHTRRCRAKVNSKFQELLGILPAPPANTGIKHKAQILDYTIRVFRDIHARKTLLEAELALSSRAHLNTWVENIVARAFTLQDLLAPYLSLICTKGRWKYSEAWVCSQDPPSLGGLNTPTDAMSSHSRILTPNNSSIGLTSKLRLGITVIPSPGNTEDPELQTKLERFRDKSRPYACKARIDLPGRILCTMRPEWLPSLGDTEAFQRARLANDASLVMCFGVPVFVRGNVAAVTLFFDTAQRPYDAKCVDLAVNVASLLGSAFGESAVRKGQCQ